MFRFLDRCDALDKQLQKNLITTTRHLCKKFMIEKTDAIVLHNMPYRESSSIVTLFTREKGKLSVLAHGARSAKSKFGSTLQVFSHIEVIYYYKDGRSLQTLRESGHLSRFTHLRDSLTRVSYGLQILELVKALSEEEDPHPEIYDLLNSVLYSLNIYEDNIRNIWPFFQLRFGSMLGFAPHFSKEDIEEIDVTGGYLSLETGAICRLDSGRKFTRRGSRIALRAFTIFARSDIETISRMRIPDAQFDEVASLINAFVRFHVNEAYPTKSASIINVLLKTTENDA